MLSGTTFTNFIRRISPVFTPRFHNLYSKSTFHHEQKTGPEARFF